MPNPTPAERRALLFLGLVALLGGSVRLWRSHAGGRGVMHATTTAADSSPVARHGTARPRRGRPAGTRRPSRSLAPDRDSLVILDLDRATVAQIEALGVLRRGVARLIVADRDRYGPFGSLDELRRVDVLTVSDVRKLAPHVTFSLLPRPRNAVLQARPVAAPARRRRARRPAPEPQP